MIYKVTIKNKLFSVEFHLRSLNEYVPPNETAISNIYTEVSKLDTFNDLSKTLEKFVKDSLPHPVKMLDS